jgi:TRAP-type C4-dicarboxylate transport system permease small subunit
MNFINRLLGTTIRIMGVIGASVMVMVALLILIDAILRKFGNALEYTYDAVELMIVIVAICGITYCELSGAHVVVDIVTNKLKPTVKRILATIGAAFCLAISILVTWQVTVTANKSWIVGEETNTMYWPITPFRIIFVFGWIVLCIVIVVGLINMFKGTLKIEKKSEIEEELETAHEKSEVKGESEL